ncbi:hypothetical protein VitviT2T_020498 [Vitis vinifera]|uniref:Uncharacterized protein n=1 Tax=Vitis vinifera TaxID=29760 RepID=A0ABY9D3X6_VITVI|nr:hypothetical protein VitviT2T_020498 [Vitis vinifera]
MKKDSWLFEQAGQLNYRNEEAYLYNYIEMRLSNLFFKWFSFGIGRLAGIMQIFKNVIWVGPVHVQWAGPRPTSWAWQPMISDLRWTGLDGLAQFCLPSQASPVLFNLQNKVKEGKSE